METKVALLVIYNHRYDKNIPRINDLYREKFSHIFHVMPFYDGKEENVLPVYESSYYFSGYVAQAYTHLRGKGFTHFFAVADDMVINPKINEDNLWDVTGIDKDACFIDDFLILQKNNRFWKHLIKGVRYNPKKKGVEIMNILPPKDTAIEKFNNFDIPTYKLPFRVALSPLRYGMIHQTIQILAKSKLSYPLVGGYSDIFVVTSDVMDDFCKYCGAFAASELFVEMAIPTAMVLSAKKIQHSKDIKMKSGTLWGKRKKEVMDKYNGNLDELMRLYDKETLFLHPIKLSQWK